MRGWVVVTTTGARNSSPPRSVTPRARPRETSIRATGAPVRTVAPCARAAAASARVRPPIPPSGNPHCPSWPSPTSPMWWCAITYAVPGERGPAHVPITPLTDSTPCISGDSKKSSSRSAMLIVNSRVASATARVSSRRRDHASCSWSTRSAGRCDPRRGGTADSNGPNTEARPSNHASHFSIASASRRENWAIWSRRALGDEGSRNARPSAYGAKYGPCGNTRYPCCSSDSSRISAGGSRLTTYDRVVTL